MIEIIIFAILLVALTVVWIWAIAYAISAPLEDHKFCDRRLENTPGFLVCDYTPGGTPQISFTSQPVLKDVNKDD